MRRALILPLLPAALIAQVPGTARSTPAPAAAPEADHAQVKKLLLAMKFPEQLKHGFLQAIDGEAAKSATMPPGFLDAFKAAFNPDDFVEQIIPIYAKRLTNEEVKAALNFYSSPEGASFAAKQAELATDLQKIGQQYGMKLALKVMQDQMKEDAPK